MSDELVLRLTELAIDAGMDICLHYPPHKMMMSFKHPRVPNNTPQKYGQESLEKDRVFEQMFHSDDQPDVPTNVPTNRWTTENHDDRINAPDCSFKEAIDRWTEEVLENHDGDPDGTNGDVPFVLLTPEEEAAWKQQLDLDLDRMVRERAAYFANR
jgi:hypothetical protein